jgi:hypothetical protein
MAPIAAAAQVIPTGAVLFLIIHRAWIDLPLNLILSTHPFTSIPLLQSNAQPSDLELADADAQTLCLLQLVQALVD